MAEETPGEWYHRMQRSDASVWADEFLQANPECNVDRGMMIAWFANCYMAGYDFARGEPLNGDHAEWLIGNGKTP